MLFKLNNPMVFLTEQERNRLQDDYRKLINKKIRQFCKKAKR